MAPWPCCRVPGVGLRTASLSAASVSSIVGSSSSSSANGLERRTAADGVDGRGGEADNRWGDGRGGREVAGATGLGGGGSGAGAGQNGGGESTGRGGGGGGFTRGGGGEIAWRDAARRAVMFVEGMEASSSSFSASGVVKSACRSPPVSSDPGFKAKYRKPIALLRMKLKAQSCQTLSLPV